MNLYLLFISIVLSQSIVNGRYLDDDDDVFINLSIFNNEDYGFWETDTDQAGGIDCQNEGTWPDNWIEFENEVLTLVNKVRARGTSCGGHWRSPVSSITLNSQLTRSARCHAVDMIRNNYFDHVNQQGVTMGGRVRQAGYRYSAVGENIAHGQRSPQQVVNDWKNSPGHCNNMMDDYEEIGIGYVGENSHMWVQNFGTSY